MTHAKQIVTFVARSLDPDATDEEVDMAVARALDHARRQDPEGAEQLVREYQLAGAEQAIAEYLEEHP